MSYKKVIKRYDDDYVTYKNVDITSGVIVGKYDNNRAFIIINGDWYIISNNYISRNSFTHKALDYIFNVPNEQYSKDVRQYDNFFEASQYINEIIGECND